MAGGDGPGRAVVTQAASSLLVNAHYREPRLAPRANERAAHDTTDSANHWYRMCSGLYRCRLQHESGVAPLVYEYNVNVKSIYQKACWRPTALERGRLVTSLDKLLMSGAMFPLDTRHSTLDTRHPTHSLAVTIYLSIQREPFITSHQEDGSQLTPQSAPTVQLCYSDSH
ncbi:unnamed protein product [Danaus chrysippus]|uniref:(African queen) hypothetical protein n=1 Tax=Danaus chrysippus TaxID=151541 RepID=A0A8J2RIA7_9NEOP|nr:unnamed protein product [Danaus chrysippus]